MSLTGIFPIDKWDFHSKTILAGLAEGELKQLMAHAREERYLKGEMIFREGDMPAGIYYIRSGVVKKYKIDGEGREHIFYIGCAGELIGYHAVLSNEPYADAAAALEDSLISFIPLSDFLAVLDSSPTLSRQLLKTLSHEFTVFINNMSVFAQRPVRERIAIALIILREKFKHSTKEGQPIMIKISRDDIANMSGTTRENVARALTDFREENIIATSGRKIEVIDIERLVNISNFSD